MRLTTFALIAALLTACATAPQVARSGPIEVRLHTDARAVDFACREAGLAVAGEIRGCIRGDVGTDRIVLDVWPDAKTLAHETCHVWLWTRGGDREHRICD